MTIDDLEKIFDDAAAPDVCEHVDLGLGFFRASCKSNQSDCAIIDFPSEEGKGCPSCGKPISFKEANHG